jgi:AcrR family transcriptional regulator
MPETTRHSSERGIERETIWTRPDRGARGPQPEHSRAEIASAAVTLADSGGLSAASMRAVARSLGTAAGSLYRYLSSRDDLLDLMVDTAIAELRLNPETRGSWLDDLVALARDQLALYRRHPWLLEASLRPAALGPHAMDYFEHCLRIMAPLACGTTTKLEAIAMITGVVSLFARSESAAQGQTASPSHPFGTATPEAHPHLIAALTQPTPPAPQADLFERTIRGLLRGLLVEGSDQTGGP